MRTDAQPVYLGWAKPGVATSTKDWFIQKFTYDGSDRMTLRQRALGSWDNRTSLSYE